ncbi:hypothetical protein [Azorhizophilus paspali]|uniref:hypothetical protein n=1 Tax=Azorhizophilus paspali TaxID=69963 RepID=UPI0037495B5A
MNAAQFEAAKGRAEETIRHYVGMFERNGSDGWPTAAFCDGLIQMAGVTGHLSEVSIKYWEQCLERIKDAHWKSINVKIGKEAA